MWWQIRVFLHAALFQWCRSKNTHLFRAALLFARRERGGFLAQIENLNNVFLLLTCFRLFAAFVQCKRPLEILIFNRMYKLPLLVAYKCGNDVTRVFVWFYPLF